MSYDLYCYISKKGKPDLHEAETLVANDQAEDLVLSPANRKMIIAAIIKECPSLLCEGIPVMDCLDKIEDSDELIELNTPPDDPAIQIMIENQYVLITTPYWYHGEKATRLFKTIASLVKCLRESVGYFLYDPQMGIVSDPVKHPFNGLEKYLEVSEHWDQIASSKNGEPEPKKPWWRFW